METGGGGAGLRGERGTGGPGRAGDHGSRWGGVGHAPVLTLQPSFRSGPGPRGCCEVGGLTFPPACIPAGGDLFLNPDICFSESDGAAPSEAQIPAPLLLPALGPGLVQAMSQLVALLCRAGSGEPVGMTARCPFSLGSYPAPPPWCPKPAACSSAAGDPAGHEAAGINSFFQAGI